jgi:hypothetical protein
MENKRNVWLLPTYKPSRLGYLTKKGKEVFNDLRLFEKPMPNILDSENQHIYITNNEEIKEGDWLYVKTPNIYGGNVIAKSLGNSNGCWADYILTETTDEKGYHPSHCKKIILTTDQALIADGVQSIDDEFLEWFVKNSSCESVEVKNPLIANVSDFGYKTIIPQEESKQETLEEFAFEKYPRSMSEKDSELRNIFSEGLELGAKWQKEQDKNKYSDEEVLEALEELKKAPLIFVPDERMYSEEDLLSAFEAGMIFIGEDKGSFREWFEQVKKK